MLFALFLALNYGVFKIPTINFLTTLTKTSILPNRNTIDILMLSNTLEAADKLWNEGYYKKSVKLREEILVAAYSYHGVLNDQYFPPIMSNNWTTAIGHKAALAHHLNGQKLGILPLGKRILVTDNSKTENSLLETMTSGFHFTKYQHGSCWTDLPNFIHSVELLSTIRVRNGFMDLYKLFEESFSHHNKLLPNSTILKLDAIKVENGEQGLTLLGLPRNSWFVALHIREDKTPDGRRNQPVESFEKVINFIISLGGFVIRIGDNKMTELKPRTGLIDLTQMPKARTDLHTYILSQASFFIGTTSGPSLIPPLFGVPSLITNVTSIGRNTLTANFSTIYLPKKYLLKGFHELSLSDILTSNEAYSESSLRYLQKNDLQLIPNSDIEILIAFKELMENSITKSANRISNLQNKVNEIRYQADAVSFGNFSESYLNDNENWFL